MKLPGFLTPNVITSLRIAFLPLGAYALFKNGAGPPSAVPARDLPGWPGGVPSATPAWSSSEV